MNATLAFDTSALAFTSEFQLAGARCIFSTNVRELRDNSLNWRAVSSPSSSETFEMEILVDPHVRFDSARGAHFRGLHHLVFAVLPPFGSFTFDLLRKRVVGVVASEVADDDIFWNAQLLPIAIGVLGTTVGVAPMHCACLDHQGDALLLAGHSGAGKSTLAAALAQCGFSFVSDDWTYISRGRSFVVAHGLFAPIKLLPDSARFFPQLKELSPVRTLNGEVAYELDADRHMGASMKRNSRPKWIFFLERTNSSGCQFNPCRPEFTRQFFEQNAERLPCELLDAQRRRSALIQELSECPSWVIRTAEGPLETARALSQFIAEKNHVNE